MSRIRVRFTSPVGGGTMEFDSSATLANLVLQLCCETGKMWTDMRFGWPVRKIDLQDPSVSLASLGLDGGAITLSKERKLDNFLSSDPTVAMSQMGGDSPAWPAEAQARLSPAVHSMLPNNVHVPWPERGGALGELPTPLFVLRTSEYPSVGAVIADRILPPSSKVLRVMQQDNNCLFTAFGGVVGVTDPAELRHHVSMAILANPDVYNAVVLEMPPSQYCRLIVNTNVWGGAIELGLLSDLFDIEICSVDVETGRVDRFGLHKTRRCILSYTGAHYDRVAFVPINVIHGPDRFDRAEQDRTTWDITDHDVLSAAVELAGKLKMMHYFVRSQGLILTCDAPGCGWVGMGVRMAQNHSLSTGHCGVSEVIR